LPTAKPRGDGDAVGMEEDLGLSTLARSGAGAGPLRALLEAQGSGAAAVACGVSAWRAAGLPEHAIERLSIGDARARALDERWLARRGHRVIGWHDPAYPPLLRNGGSPPAVLYLAGDASLLWQPQVAIVGSRRPTAGGRDNAYAFARACAGAGVVVTSGLASGIDAAAHLGALELGRTIAVLGNGTERCYPRAHHALLERIAAEGLVLSEHPPDAPSRKQNFPSRNRLIAGLSLATLVVEAAFESGALITARQAADAGREVCALPGSIHNPMARGCHQLLREGAALVETPEELLALLAPLARRARENLRGVDASFCLESKDVQRHLFSDEHPDPVAREILRKMSHDPVNLDQLCQRTGLTVAPLSAMLVSLELEGKITAEHGRYTRRC
jgi:DNA processing protein